MFKTLIFTIIFSDFLVSFWVTTDACYLYENHYATHKIRLEECDSDGYTTFNLTKADTLLVPKEDSKNFIINYYRTQEDAINNQQPILTYQNTIEGAQGNEQLHARITNRTTHEIHYHTIALYINYPPDIVSESIEILCDNIGTLLLDAGFNTAINASDYDFLWSTESTASEIQVTTPGLYSVLVTNKATGCSAYREIEVVSSGPAKTIQVDIDNRNARITVEGAGFYQFAIETDGVLSSYQESNVFSKLSTGAHTVYIKDSNGCLPIRTKEILIIDIPEFFTPNGDGINDSWQVDGLGADDMKNALIYIFDKHGKLIKQVVIDGSGWDGTYNGNPLPKSQYWYLIEFGNKKIKGSFTLLR
ncbi:T9SS type B sorting domain-containing protein [Aquimarina intermedia]|uniref:Gliding motility-associated-like protein n=1 Tax=Aquimarina intermedia TaxID=350814 RepID=A0A5S5BTD8_9FLAO|nr:T9SS type B sorting domain-containing protein [Aquimarina intermedia]TYP70445.1 gliding motility-associated-like protein [Aquimarina intermedia]